MTTDLEHYDVEIEVYTQVHIGTGDKVGPLHWTLSNGEFRVWKTERWMRSNIQEANAVLAQLERNVRTFQLDEHSGNGLPTEFLSYKAEIGNAEITLLRDEARRGSPNRDVAVFYKNPITAKPVIPGSTLKGALRTAWLYHLLKHDRDRIDRIISQLITTNGRINTKSIGQQTVEDYLIGRLGMGGNRPTFDVFKAISVRDTELIQGGLRVERIDTLSELRDGSKKRKDWKTFAECLKPETRLRTTITIDRGLLRDYSTAHGWSNAQTNITINRLWEALREFSSDVVEDEIRYYQNVGDVRGLYDGENDGLRMLIAEMDASQCAFSIGFGSGWLRLTVGRLLRERSNEHQWQTIRRRLGLANNRLDFDFPKSRKNWVDYDPDDGKWYSYNPLGWVRAVYTQR